MLVDSHCHLDRVSLKPYDDDFDRLMSETRIAGVTAKLLLLIRTLGVVPQRLHVMSRLGPGPSKLRP